MARRRRKVKINKLMLPITIVLVVSVLVAAAAIYQYRPPKQPEKAPASEYFQILDATPIGGSFEDNRTRLKITELEFTIKAVGGPAHGIYIYGLGYSEGQEIGDLQNGTETRVDLYGSNTFPYYSTKTPDGLWPVQITVTCTEADGTITFYLTE